VLGLPLYYEASLTTSLWIAQDFLTFSSVTWSTGQGFNSSNSPRWGNAAYFAGSVFRAMPLILLTTICLLACVFLLLVLYQWMRDTKRKATTRPGADNEVGETREEKRPHVIGPRRAVERRDRFKIKSHRLAAPTERTGGRRPEYNESERMAYERIARSLRPRNRS